MLEPVTETLSICLKFSTLDYWGEYWFEKAMQIQVSGMRGVGLRGQSVEGWTRTDL